MTPETATQFKAFVRRRTRIASYKKAHKRLGSDMAVLWREFLRLHPEDKPDFCRYCGASIPPRDGEGTCEKCEHPKEKHDGYR